MVAILRRFLREGLPWRSLRATVEQVSGSTLRRFLAYWAENAVLAKVHALLVAMLRGNPTLILDSCSVRAKRGGDLVGPNPTDRVKMGSKYHIATDGDGTPVACLATAANVPDRLVFERLFLTAFAVMARIRTVYADKGYDAGRHRQLCRACKVKPFTHKRGRPHGSGLGRYRWPVEPRSVGCWRTSASACATTAAASSFNPCCKPDAYSWLHPDPSLRSPDTRLRKTLIYRPVKTRAHGH
jgi:hypothetical protein